MPTIDEPVAQPTFSDATRRVLEMAGENQVDVDVCRRLVLQRIAELDREQEGLRSCYNTMAGACKIPNEILSEIFLTSKDSASSASSDVPWTGIAQVCRHWRRAAMGCTELWTALDFSKPSKVLKYQLKMSQGAPLSVEVVDSEIHYTSRGLVRDVLAQSGRLQAIQVKVVMSDLTPLLGLLPQNWIQTPLPLLEVIRLETGDYAAGLNSFPLPPLVQDHPVLRRLELGWHCVAWAELPLGPKITHLTLHNSTFLSGERRKPSTSEFFSSFQRMPNLKVVQLGLILPMDSDTLPAFGIELHSLQRLTLFDFPCHIWSFLKRASHLPSLKALSIGFACEADDPTACRTALQTMKASLPTAMRAATDPTRLTILVWPQKHLNFTFQPTNSSSLRHEPTGGLSIQFTFSSDSFSPLCHNRYLDLTCEELEGSVRTTASLRIQLSEERSQHGEQRVFRLLRDLTFPRLEVLYLRDCGPQDVISLCNALTVESKSLGSMEEEHLPVLRRMDMGRVEFVDEGSPVGQANAVPEAVRRLVDALRAMPQVQELAIKECPDFTQEVCEFVRQALPALKIEIH